MDRIQIIKKYANKKERPTKKELEEAYSYLDCCLSCGHKFNFIDRILFRYNHTFIGNYCKRCFKQCNKTMK